MRSKLNSQVLRILTFEKQLFTKSARENHVGRVGFPNITVSELAASRTVERRYVLYTRNRTSGLGVNSFVRYSNLCPIFLSVFNQVDIFLLSRKNLIIEIFLKLNEITL